MVETRQALTNFAEHYAPHQTPQDKEEKLKLLAFRLNLANAYLLNNLCNVARIHPAQENKYSRHNPKSYMDMKKKGVRLEARQERLANQRAIIKELANCDIETINLACEDLTRHLRADGFKFRA